MIGTSQLINTFSRPCFTDTTDIFKDGSGVALYGLDYDASDAGGASGKFGEAAIFNGSSSYIDTGISSLGANFSVSMWINENALDSGGFFGNWNGTSNDDMFWRTQSDGSLRVNIDGTSNQYFGSAGDVTINTWHHIVVSFNSGTYEVYLDSNSLGTATTSNTVFNSGANFYIGDDNSATYFDGKIDQVRIYDSTLIQSQVTQLYQENSSTVGTHLFGCIANYNLDGSAKESMGTTAYDGTETDITYRYDGTPTAVDFGVGGKSDYGARFNGSSSYISGVPALTNSNAEFTISMWFKCNTTASSQYLFGEIRENGTYDPLFLIWLNTSGYLNTEFRNNSSSTSGVTITDSTNYCDDSWHHIVSILTTSQMKMYIDGSEVSSSPANISGVCDVNNISIGARNNRGTNGNWFNGDIDQVRIFSKALSTAEVGKLYGNGAGEIACTYTSTTDNVAYPIANTAYYKLDNNSKDSARSTGKFNEGAIFNGSSSYITSNSLPSIGTGDFTFSCWFNQNSGSSQGALFSTTTQWFAANGNVSPKVLMVTDDTVTKKGDTTYSQDTWNHAVFARESGVLKMYQNGTEVFSGTYTDSWDMTQFGIGVARAFGSRVYYFNGEIDQVRIYNTALSSTDVLNLYAETVSDTSTLSFPSGKTAIATYQLDGNSTDLSGNYNGTDTNITYAYDGTESNIEYRFGRYGQAAVFNGSTSYIESGISTNILNSDYTISFWGKSSNSSGGQTFINTNSGAVAFVRIDFSADGNLYFYHRNSASTTYVDASIVSGMADGNWHHVVITKDNTSVKAYKDGSLVGTITSTSGTYSNSTTLQIGRNNYNANGANNFDGDIDQVRIYSSALTSSQVTQLYNEKPEVDTSNFKTVLYTGNGGTQYISNVGFDLETNGGLVWIKSRTLAASHGLYDFVRGAGYWLRSDSTDAQQFQRSTGYLSSFDSNGFTLSEGSSTHPTYTASYETHQINQDYVAWVFKAGGEAVQNTQGDINSDVSANKDSGFSIVKYTGNATAGATVGHGLDNPPEMIIVKGIDNSLNWIVYHTGIGASDYIQLNTSGATESQSSYNMFNSTAPSSTLFTLGNIANTNGSGLNYIAYCFHSVAGYSKIGSYTGNGSSTGPNVTLGFTPSFLMIKRTDSGDNWLVFDNKRNTTNPTNLALVPNSSAAESVGNLGNGFNFLSNGFEVVSTDTGINANGGEYIYMAFK